jgi:hypothetical protein
MIVVVNHDRHLVFRPVLIHFILLIFNHLVTLSRAYRANLVRWGSRKIVHPYWNYTYTNTTSQENILVLQ